MEVGGELIMGFSESQEMNPRREMEDGKERRMLENSRAERGGEEGKKGASGPGEERSSSCSLLRPGLLLDDQHRDGQAP